MSRSDSHLDDAYRRFHKHNPDRTIDMPKAWVPGPMAFMGHAADVGYTRATSHSDKDARYVHDIKTVVEVYRRKRRSEKADKTFDMFEQCLIVLGYALGFSYIDDKGKQEIQAQPGWYLCTPESRDMLAIVDESGVLYVMTGGLRIDDWIYDSDENGHLSR